MMSTLGSARRSSAAVAVTPNSAPLAAATSGFMSAMARMSRTGKARIARRYWAEMLPAPMMPMPRRCRAAMKASQELGGRNGAARWLHVLAGPRPVGSGYMRDCGAFSSGRNREGRCLLVMASHFRRPRVNVARRILTVDLAAGARRYRGHHRAERIGFAVACGSACEHAAACACEDDDA